MIALATCAAGAEKVLSGELRKLKEKTDISILDAGYGNVLFKTCVQGLYFALMSLRTADRIFLVLSPDVVEHKMDFDRIAASGKPKPEFSPTGQFDASDFDALFDGVSSIPFEDYVSKDFCIVVDKVRSKQSRLAAQNAVQAMVHKAAAQRLCKKYNVERLDDNGKKAVLRVYIDKDKARILLDICGSPLFKRAYREDGGGAPLRETTAAALLFLSRWRRKIPLWDPFCGSGTIAIEAALYAWNAAPNMKRCFALDGLLIADKKIEEQVRQILIEQIDFSVPFKIYGSDEDRRMVEIAKSNLQRAIRLVCGGKGTAQKDFSVMPASMPDFWALNMKDAKGLENDGIIICNPPYGKRVGNEEDAIKNYSQMSVLQENFSSWKICVISDHSGFESFFATRANSCTKITNGPLDTYFYEYLPKLEKDAIKMPAVEPRTRNKAHTEGGFVIPKTYNTDLMKNDRNTRTNYGNGTGSTAGGSVRPAKRGCSEGGSTPRKHNPKKNIDWTW
ncbi:MAG: class I SAM-dependent RNA methyltransferase [Termitinemataceae bacterium]|nr:MAG: class I SAM-dependent RNA methyltransferase [Termitinemataceae bacterium]